MPVSSENAPSINYDANTKFATYSVKDQSNSNSETVKVFVPSEGAMDSQYVEMQLSGQSHFC